MALRKGSTAEIALVDLAMNIIAFEAMNNCRIVMQLSVIDRGGSADVMIEATAFDRALDPAVVASLASVKVSARSTGLYSLDAALIHTLYTLDGQLARNALSED